MDIAIIGPCGDVGRQIVQQVVVERLLGCDERLVLVANPDGASARSVYGLVADLSDAYAEFAPQMEVVLDPSDIRADLIVEAAGATPAPTFERAPLSRDALAERNAPIFAAHARAIARSGSGHEIVVCISNPNELAVAVFARELGRMRAIGIGAFLDSLRFRQELALDLGIRRQRIHAFIAGEHGAAVVPLWSNVHVYGLEDDELRRRLLRARRGVDEAAFPAALRTAQTRVEQLIVAGRTREAYATVDALSPDIRVVVRPFVTHYSGAKTVIGTARATMEFLRTIALGADALVSGQVSLDGEAYDIHGTIGLPFVVGNRGVDRVFELPLEPLERRRLRESAEAVRQKIARHL